MPTCLKKYRKPLFLLVLFIYTLSSLSTSFKEACHFVLHLDDISVHNYEHHIYHSHNANHSHVLLDLMADTTPVHDDHHIPNELKKKVEINDNFLATLNSPVLYTKHRFYFHVFPKDPYPERTFFPPDFI